jgi:hypothetical protein
VRRVFGIKRNEISGRLRKVINKKFTIHTLYVTIRVIKSGWMKWVMHTDVRSFSYFV